jgi:FdhD protein
VPPTNSVSASVLQHTVVRRDVHGLAPAEVWGIAVETPVQIGLNGTPWIVVLASPSDLEDLAIGLATSEHIVRDAACVTAVHVSAGLGEATINIEAPDHVLNTAGVRARAIPGTSSCGLCGIESLAQLQAHRDAARVPVGVRPTQITDAAIRSAFAALPAAQPINAATHSVHVAAWCAPDGAVQLAREDVGRHNALDKLIGALARRSALVDPGFIVMSSRCSYELVAKASVTGASLLATISAPTSMALTWSAALYLPLVCRARGAQLVHFPGRATHAG